MFVFSFQSSQRKVFEELRRQHRQERGCDKERLDELAHTMRQSLYERQKQQRNNAKLRFNAQELIEYDDYLQYNKFFICKADACQICDEVLQTPMRNELMLYEMDKLNLQ